MHKAMHFTTSIARRTAPHMQAFDEAQVPILAKYYAMDCAYLKEIGDNFLTVVGDVLGPS